ncbi:MAG: FecR family protein, partial [Chitinophagaceae bacterium]
MHNDHFWNLLAKKLAGEASAGELEELVSLIKTYPELSYAAQQVTDLWQIQSPASPHLAEKALEKHLVKLHGMPFTESRPENTELAFSSPTPRRYWKLLVGGILLLVLIGAGFYMNRSGNSGGNNQLTKQTEEVFTRPGTRTKLLLSDSTVVWLNAGSKLTYSQPFGVNDRTVTLTGEAYFDVKKSTKPFIIHTSGIQIRVLGTAFNVRSYPTEKKVETSLIRGRVEITVDKKPGDKYVLLPSEKLTLTTGQKTVSHSAKRLHEPTVVRSTINYLNTTTIAETSWVENKLVFDDESFEEIAKKMERWYGVSIRFKNE